MAARVFLWIIAVLVSIAVLAAIGWSVFGDRIIRRMTVPTVTFAESPQAPPTIYDAEVSWLYRPGLPPLKADWVPPCPPEIDDEETSEEEVAAENPDGDMVADEGASDGVTDTEGEDDAAEGEADEEAEVTCDPETPRAAVFYVHPTTYLGRDRWNAATDPEDEGARVRRQIFARSQASVFSGFADIWAPKYRQAAFGAFVAFEEPDAQKAFALAYSDIANAFDEFLANIPLDEPIILAGHSQGALHLGTLLADRAGDEALRKRIVAAYIIGWPISVPADLPALGLPGCETRDDSGCIIAFQSFSEPADPSLIVKPFSMTEGLAGLPRADTELLCVNPLTGGIGGEAGPDADLGSLIPRDDLLDATLEPGLVGARCGEDGFLLIGEGPPKEFSKYALPGGNMHVYDFPLFWANLRADAYRRLARYEEVGANPPADNEVGLQ